MTHDTAVHIHDPDPPSIDNTWTEERVALLIKLRATGTSRRGIASEINTRTGSQFTKSAICGKIDRLFPVAKPRKTDEEKAAAIRAQRDRENARKREQTRQRRIAVGVNPDIHPKARPPVLRVVKAVPRHLTLLELTDETCKYECSGSTEPRDFTFCGNPVHTGSYCGEHHFLCTRPPFALRDRAYIGGRRVA